MAGEGVKDPMADAKAEEGEEDKGYPIVPCAAKTLVISQKIANTIKWLESSNRKTRLPKAAKHLITCSTALTAKW